MKAKKIIMALCLGWSLSFVAFSSTASAGIQAINDRYYDRQWGLNNENDIDIDFPEARAEYSGGKREVVVAIIDTGVDYEHEDLKDVFWVNKGEIPYNGIDDDKNGYIDDINGWNFHDDNNVIYSGADDVHGTHIAGTIAANINGIGIAGVAGNGSVKLMVLKAMKGETGYTNSVAEAIQYAEKMGASICNLSFGTDKSDKYLEETIKDSKMLFVVASGNGDAYGRGYDIDTSPMYPASYNYDNIIAVANLQEDGSLHKSSNYGVNSVDIAAPGNMIYSTIDSDNYYKKILSGGIYAPYAYMHGTSMAVPFVVGTAALIYSEFPEVSLAEVRQAILNGSKRYYKLAGLVKTGGMVSAEEAYNYLKNIVQVKAKEAAEKEVAEKEAEKETAAKEEAAKEAASKEETKAKASKGSSPSIKLSIIGRGKLRIKISDEDKDIKEVKYAKGNRSSAYFNKKGKGIKIKLNSKNEKILNIRSGTYTFYAIDKKGNIKIGIADI